MYADVTTQGNDRKRLGSLRLFPLVRYCILPSVVWCGAVHTFNQTLFLKANTCKLQNFYLFTGHFGFYQDIRIIFELTL